MGMGQVIYIGQVIISALLILAILLQHRGAGLSAVFGGSGNIYRTKRGLERGLFIFTIILVILFVGLGVTNLILSS